MRSKSVASPRLATRSTTSAKRSPAEQSTAPAALRHATHYTVLHEQRKASMGKAPAMFCLMMLCTGIAKPRRAQLCRAAKQIIAEWSSGGAKRCIAERPRSYSIQTNATGEAMRSTSGRPAMHSKAKQSEADGKAMLRDAWRADRQGETPLCDTI